ncbi:Monoacylglycerol lipase ABHD12 [Gryllus bimaculatus]|nr:Monoacylglycerol lipase ABHD12 [Gryllus bimaculatus]
MSAIKYILLLVIIPMSLWYWGEIFILSMRLSLGVVFVIFILVPLIFKYTYSLQRSMVFLNFVTWPRNADYNAPEKYGLAGTKNFYVTSDDGVTLGVWHTLPASMDNENVSKGNFEAALSHGEPVVLYMHGNSGSRASPHRVELYNVLRNLNYHVISFDYRSYADSTDIEPTEEGVVADGKFMYRWLERRVKSSPLLVWGHSLGTGVSSHVLADLAKEGTQVLGLVLESPFNNLRDEVREHPFAALFRHLPWFEMCFLEPIHANKIQFTSDEHITHFLAPILILHAEDDLVVPYLLGKRVSINFLMDVLMFEIFKNFIYGGNQIITFCNLPYDTLKIV